MSRIYKIEAGGSELDPIELVLKWAEEDGRDVLKIPAKHLSLHVCGGEIKEVKDNA